MKKYVVNLGSEERQRLEQVVRVGRAAAYRIRHANPENHSILGTGAGLISWWCQDEGCRRRAGVWRECTHR